MDTAAGRLPRPGAPGGPPIARRPSPRDMVTAAIFTIVGVVAAYSEAHPTRPSAYFSGGHHLPHTPAAALLLVAAAAASLAWRRCFPRAVLCFSTAAVVAYTLPGYVNGASLLLPAIALGSLAALLPIRRSAGWAVALTAVLTAATAVNNPFGPFNGGFLVIPANDAVALFAGIAIGNRNAFLAAARRQAEQDAERDTRRRIDEERLRIARELHDVVAHTMATITVQAAAAAQLLSDRPERAAESLQAIRAAGKDGLRELHAIVNVLRTAGEPADPTEPPPGLARLDSLVAGVRAAGLPVTVAVAGQPRELPAITDLAAYRIIQEALTNVIRHAGPASAHLSVRYTSAVLCVAITDTGRGGGEGTGSGHGLRGMRERAAAAGAAIEIGPMQAGGFRVAVSFPLPSPDEANGPPGGPAAAIAPIAAAAVTGRTQEAR